jgi:hypothetical protein
MTKRMLTTLQELRAAASTYATDKKIAATYRGWNIWKIKLGHSKAVIRHASMSKLIAIKGEFDDGKNPCLHVSCPPVALLGSNPEDSLEAAWNAVAKEIDRIERTWKI